MNKRVIKKLFVPISIVLIFCLFISSFMIWRLQDVFRAVDHFDSTPISEFEVEEYSPDLSDAAMISSIEGNAEFKFPSSSRDIYAFTTGLQDIFIQTRFTINTAELSELISSTRCNVPLKLLQTPLESPITKPDWWKLPEAKIVKGCSGVTENFGQMVYVDMTKTEEYIIYIEGGTH